MDKKYPQPAIGAFIINRKKQILLIKSHKWANGNLWSVPGGRIEIGETIGHAVIRETEEEVGLKAKFNKVFLVVDAINPKNFFRKQHFIFLECLCEVENDKFKLDQDEIQEARWFDFKELKNLNIEPFTLNAIKELEKEI